MVITRSCFLLEGKDVGVEWSVKGVFSSSVDSERLTSQMYTTYSFYGSLGGWIRSFLYPELLFKATRYGGGGASTRLCRSCLVNVADVHRRKDDVWEGRRRRLDAGHCPGVDEGLHVLEHIFSWNSPQWLCLELNPNMVF